MGIPLAEDRWGSIRRELKELLGVDRWVEDVDVPVIAPRTTNEVVKLLRGSKIPITVLGSASSLPADWSPPESQLILLTTGLKERFDLNPLGGTLTVSAGFPVVAIKERLRSAGLAVTALERFDSGTVGGRLAFVPSMISIQTPCDWVHSLLSLEVVLPNGQDIVLGTRAIKDVAGYDLRHLFTGSRGSLAVITTAIFRVLPVTLLLAIEPLRNPPIYPIHSGLKRLLDPNGRLKSAFNLPN